METVKRAKAKKVSERKTKKPIARKKTSDAKTARPRQEKQSDIAESYNRFKEYEGKFYTGMKIGRSHSWNYDPGRWKETKLTPDLWEINYAVTKRRAGHAPEGSGVPVGTQYHWYIMAHQHVEKLDANTYTTAMTGLKFKIAHKRADAEKWNVTEKTQRKRLIKMLHKLIEQLEGEIDKK